LHTFGQLCWIDRSRPKAGVGSKSGVLESGHSKKCGSCQLTSAQKFESVRFASEAGPRYVSFTNVWVRKAGLLTLCK